MTEKFIVITGGSDGIGAAAARTLTGLGANVAIVGRTPKKTARVAGELGIPYYLADFAKLSDVRSLAEQLRSDFAQIDVLANNAGGVMGDRQVTVDGNELTLQVNHLAPFLLTHLLLDRLIASGGSVVATSSLAHRAAGKLDLQDINLQRGYSQQRAYSKAKLMNILFTRELHRRFHTTGIASAAFHPGVVRTSFSAEFGGNVSLVYTSVARHLLRSPIKGADTMVWLATSKAGQEWESGEYYKDRKIAQTTRQAQNTALASDLWELSARLTDLS